MFAWNPEASPGKTKLFRHRRLAFGLAILISCWNVALAQNVLGQRRGPSVIIAALDLNGDSTLDEEELSQAPKSLASLDRNGDGMLSREEIRPTALPGPAPQSAPASLPSKQASPATAASGPNILIIVADDLGWNGVGFHDSSAVTPQLDRLAADSTELRRFYTYAVCSPSRAALLTGQMPLRFGIVDAMDRRHPGIPKDVVTLPEIFRDAGYQTSLIGKWHLGEQRPPLASGFDHFYGHLGPSIDYYKHTNPRGQRDWQRDGTPLQESGYSTDLIADEAIRQITQRDSGQPFFMQVAFNAPHVPLAAPPELIAKHRDAGGLYAAVVDAMDAAIGRILATLDDQGLRDDTLVLFFSDNGGGRRFGDSAPLRDGKDSIYEGGIRNVCLIRWPGKIPAGTQNDHPVSLHDLFPTLAAAAEIPLSAEHSLDGSNQWPSIHSGNPVSRPPILIASRDLALIAGDWKLIQWESGKQSLYNLKTDISETNDQLESSPEIGKALTSKLSRLRQGLPAAPAASKKPKRSTQR